MKRIIILSLAAILATSCTEKKIAADYAYCDSLLSERNENLNESIVGEAEFNRESEDLISAYTFKEISLEEFEQKSKELIANFEKVCQNREKQDKQLDKEINAKLEEMNNKYGEAKLAKYCEKYRKNNNQK